MLCTEYMIICDPGSEKSGLKSESWINRLSIDDWFVSIGYYLEIQLDTAICHFKVVQIKFLAMHITTQKLSFDMFTVDNLLNMFREHDLYLIS